MRFHHESAYLLWKSQKLLNAAIFGRFESEAAYSEHSIAVYSKINGNLRDKMSLLCLKFV